MIDKQYPARWIDVYDIYDGRFRCSMECESELDAKFTAWLDSGKTKDSLVELPTLNGGVMKIAVSAVANWMLCSIEGAQEAVRLDVAFVHLMKEVNPDFVGLDD